MGGLLLLYNNLFWTTSDLWTHQAGHTGGRSHRISPPSFCGACLYFLARRIQPFFSLVDREVLRTTNDLIVLHLLGIIYIYIYLVPGIFVCVCVGKERCIPGIN